jgi:hypothetical protein
MIVYLLSLLSKARQAKTDHMDMKISQPIFGILVVLTKNELMKICDEPSISQYFLFGSLNHAQQFFMQNVAAEL